MRVTYLGYNKYPVNTTYNIIGKVKLDNYEYNVFIGIKQTIRYIFGPKPQYKLQLPKKYKY